MKNIVHKSFGMVLIAAAAIPANYFRRLST